MLLICFFSSFAVLIASLCASVATAVILFGVISSNSPHKINLTSRFVAIEKLVLLSKLRSFCCFIVNDSLGLKSSNVGKLVLGNVASLNELFVVFSVSLFLLTVSCAS